MDCTPCISRFECGCQRRSSCGGGGRGCSSIGLALVFGSFFAVAFLSKVTVDVTFFVFSLLFFAVGQQWRLAGVLCDRQWVGGVGK